jgi:hypothetical protein
VPDSGNPIVERPTDDVDVLGDSYLQQGLFALTTSVEHEGIGDAEHDRGRPCRVNQREGRYLRGASRASTVGAATPVLKTVTMMSTSWT